MSERALRPEEENFDLLSKLDLPRLCGIDTSILPDIWPEFCRRQHIRVTAVIMYENAIENQKLWAAAGVLSAGIRRGKHLRKKRLGDSTSGNYGTSIAYGTQLVRRELPDFPIEQVFAVIPENLPEGKKAILRAYGIELILAKDSLDAQRVARELGQDPEVWYTEQYWNRDNSDSYRPVGLHIGRSMPHLGAFAAGIGSGGSFAGTLGGLKESLGEARFRDIHRIAVAVEPGSKVPGVRDPIGLEPGTIPWRELASDVRYFGSEKALEFSHALWQQEGCVAGPSSGFALIGGLLSLHVLWLLQRLEPLRGPEGYVDLAVLFPDTRKPYRKEYEEAGYALPNIDIWNLPLAA